MAGTTLTSRLSQIAALLEPAVEAAVEHVAESIAETARGRCPERPGSGRLKDAIHVSALQAQPGAFAVIAGDNEAWYGHLVEFGTSHSPAHPFLGPAAEEHRGQFAAEIGAAVRGLAR